MLDFGLIERAIAELSKVPDFTVPVDAKAAEKWEQRLCPFCAESIKTKAVVCRFCGRDVPADSVRRAFLLSLELAPALSRHFGVTFEPSQKEIAEHATRAVEALTDEDVTALFPLILEQAIAAETSRREQLEETRSSNLAVLKERLARFEEDKGERERQERQQQQAREQEDSKKKADEERVSRIIKIDAEIAENKNWWASIFVLPLVFSGLAAFCSTQDGLRSGKGFSIGLWLVLGVLVLVNGFRMRNRLELLENERSRLKASMSPASTPAHLSLNEPDLPPQPTQGAGVNSDFVPPAP